LGFFSKITTLIWKQIVHPLSKPDEIVQLGAYSYELPKILSFGWSEKVVIGKFCSIAEDVKIVAGGEHNLNHVTTFPLKDRLKGSKLPIHHKGAIIIENDVWIGTGAIILAGVKIGNGAVVGAGSVVTHDVPDYAIVAGVPARVVKFRFTTDQIKKLLEIAWWNWDIEKIVENVDYFHGHVDVFIEQFSKTGLV
jgi:lipopolysaccharide transport system ATP-binding protein